MTRALNLRRVLTTVPGVLVTLAMTVVFAVAPSAHASTRARAVTVSSIAYTFQAQLSSGAHVRGWLSGSMDSTGLITATLTTADAHNAPVAENANGTVVGKGSSALVALSVTPMAGGKGSNWSLAGSAATAGSWAGTISGANAASGTWVLTPATGQSIDAGGKADAKSKDMVVVSGKLSLSVDSNGWAIGTYGTYDNLTTVVVQGWLVNGNISVAVPLKTGTIILTAWSKPGFGVQNWTGSFVGPAKGDYGSWIGRG